MTSSKSMINSIRNTMTVHENTYQMEPRRKFQDYRVKKVIKMVVDKWLTDETEYTSDMASNLATVISQEILQQIKNMGFDRYRYIVQTYIGQKRNQGLEVASRTLCDDHLDSFADYLFENKNLWCVGLVHGIYYE